MKNAIVFHGMGATPDDYWYPWLKKQLEDRGYVVDVPVLPNSDTADIKDWLPVALHQKYGQDTLLVGHSAGCPLILSVLERLTFPISQTILVAAFFEELEIPEPILQKAYDWEIIKHNAGDVTIINSDNDPWGCDSEQGLKLIGHIGGKLIVPHGEGHMGSISKNQPYREFPLLLQLI